MASELQKLGEEITEKAESFEDQTVLVAWLRNRDVGQVQLAMEDFVDWPRVIGEYSDKTLTNILENGTELQFNEWLKDFIHATVKFEVSKRNKGRRVPRGHGMSDTGEQD